MHITFIHSIKQVQSVVFKCCLPAIFSLTLMGIMYQNCKNFNDICRNYNANSTLRSVNSDEVVSIVKITSQLHFEVTKCLI